MKVGNQKVTIVMYHYVRDLTYSRYPQIKGLDINLFKEQLLHLKKFYNFVKMEEVIEAAWHEKELPNNAVLLTFDDAYKDHYNYVFPILDEMKIQGSFYPPVKAISENTVLDVNKIHFILASEEDKNKVVKDIFSLLDVYRDEYKLEQNDVYFSKLATKTRFDTKEVIFIKRLLQSELDEKLRNSITNNLFEKYIGMDEKCFSRELYMDIDQIKCMVRNGMHLGSHGYNHYWLGTLSKEKQKEQIELSIKFLKNNKVISDDWTMCYPYGSYNTDTMDLLKQHGCKLALTTKVDVADLQRDNRYELPRLDTNDLPKDRNEKPNSWYEK